MKRDPGGSIWRVIHSPIFETAFYRTFATNFRDDGLTAVEWAETQIKVLGPRGAGAQHPGNPEMWIIQTPRGLYPFRAQFMYLIDDGAKSVTIFSVRLL